MQGTAFPAPVLPGKEAAPARLGEQISSRSTLADFVARSGIGLLRVFQMSTPQGEVVTTYLEADPLDQAFRLQQTDPSEIAQLIREGTKENHGIDLAAQAPPAAEQYLEHYEPASPRQAGIGFSAPLVPGKTDLLRDLGRETAGARNAEWRAFNRSFGVTVHRAYILPTPMGDFSSVYFEAPDPVAANQAFAADTSEFGTHFKSVVEEAFGIDFSQPLPPLKLVFETAG